MEDEMFGMIAAAASFALPAPPVTTEAVTTEAVMTPMRQSPSTTSAHGFTVRHHASIAEIDRAAWDHLFAGHAEDWGYFRACELSNPAHFTLSAVAAYHGGRLVAAAPVFRIDYRLDTSLPQALRGLSTAIERMAPRLVRMPVIGFGSPMTEECPIGLSPDLDHNERRAAIAALLDGIEAHAKATGVTIIALKDVTEATRQEAGAALAGRGYTRMASLPIAIVPLPAGGLPAYFASLSQKARKSLRKKHVQSQSSDSVTVTIADSLAGIEAEAMALYRQTRANRGQSYEGFDEVPEDYFRQVLAAARGTAKVFILRVGERLAGFSLVLVEKDRVIAKFIGMDYEIARQHNIYFVNWLAVVEYCYANGIATVQAGQTTYLPKSRLGAVLRRSSVYFKHRGLVLGALFRWIGPKLSFDAVDPDLKELGDKARYVDETAPARV
ncbi:MAG: GNAT family N-acetyltransferase [Hyphomicrobiaceae bacterium]|nr:GNAT family N-acetyltransferase [Hyphomicrobiaceae bacterium]